MTDDPFYVKYYKEEHDKFEPQLTPAARTALANLKRKIKDEYGNIISAFLTLYFSATQDQTLDDLLRTLDHSERMKSNLEKTPYYNDSNWGLYESVRKDLKTILVFLKSIQFEAYWEREIRPKVRQKITDVEKELPQYNVVGEVESVLGLPLPSNQITVYLLYYSQPHGIKITGTRFLTDVAYPFRIVVRNAVHEMMHPPYHLNGDSILSEGLNSLKVDAFLMDKINHHNPAFGYNSFEGFVEEDCVQALEQLVSEKLKVEREAHSRWKENDDGMHVFAVTLYQVMKEQNYNQGKELFRDFLVRAIKSGKLAPGKIKPVFETFYSQDIR